MSEFGLFRESGIAPELAQKIQAIGHDPVAAAFGEADSSEPLDRLGGIIFNAAFSPFLRNLRFILYAHKGANLEFEPIDQRFGHLPVRRARVAIDGQHTYSFVKLDPYREMHGPSTHGPVERYTTISNMWSTRDLGGTPDTNEDLHVARILQTPDEVESVVRLIGQGVGAPEPDSQRVAEAARLMLPGQGVSFEVP